MKTSSARRLATALTAVLLSTGALAQPSSAEIPVQIDAQPLDMALNAWASQTGYSVLVPFERAAQGKMAPKVQGKLTAEQALRLLLAGSSLSYEFVGERTVAVRAVREPTLKTSDMAHKGPRYLELAQAQVESRGASNERGRSSSTVPGNTPSTDADLEEVVVTARKRQERLQDAPVPVTVLDANGLAAYSQVLLRDYYNTVPSLNLVTNFGFTQNINIRGITTGGFSNPTVGITIDDVPYGSSINNGGGNQLADIDPGDLLRVEVLRGPQGTLYGANSMGGLIKYVTKAPSFTETSGRLETGVSSVENGDEPGYHVRASGNIPLSDTLAVRLSGYTRKDPGYVDNPVIGREDVNDAQSYSGRIATLWQPSPVFSARLSALYQRTDLHGLPEANLPTAAFPWTTGLRDLEQGYMPRVGGSDREVQAYSAILQAKLGFGELASITGYNVNEYLNSFDRSANWATFTMRDYGVGGLACFDSNSVRKFTQELRLSIDGERFDWLLGGFFTEENTRVEQNFMAANQDTGDIVGLEWFRQHPIELREHAAFASVTYKVSARFDIQFGGRQTRIEQQDGVFTQAGPFVGPTPVLAPPASSKADAFTYLVTPRLKLSPDLMVYARLASGYRPGGPNFATPGAPAQYEPDETQNYEIGVKGDLLDRMLSLDASLYYIDWQDLQISLRNAQLSTYFTNGSRARSQGVELSLTARPLDGLTITGWLAFAEPELAEPFPGSGTPASPVYGESGDILPNSARRSGHLSLQQEFHVGARVTGFVGGSLTYTGDRKGVFTATPVRQDFPSYTKADLRAGLTVETWTANVFINNLTDARGLIGGGIAYQPVFARIYIQPRTIGVSLSKEF